MSKEVLHLKILAPLFIFSLISVVSFAQDKFIGPIFFDEPSGFRSFEQLAFRAQSITPADNMPEFSFVVKNKDPMIVIDSGRIKVNDTVVKIKASDTLVGDVLVFKQGGSHTIADILSHNGIEFTDNDYSGAYLWADCTGVFWKIENEDPIYFGGTISVEYKMTQKSGFFILTLQ